MPRIVIPRVNKPKSVARLTTSGGAAAGHIGASLGPADDLAVPGADDDGDRAWGAGSPSGSAYVHGARSADCNGNGIGDALDLAEGTSLDHNGNSIPDECDCLGDLDQDWDVDLYDLAALLGNYGTTAEATYEDGDLDVDGDVDLTDVTLLLAVYGLECP